MSNLTDLFFTETHEWVRIDGDKATIGITDFAQSELGKVAELDLPNVGDEIEQGNEFGEIESHKAVSDLKAPLSGVVIAINEDLEDVDPDEDHPVNVTPYTKGWLIEITINDASEVSNLMSHDAYMAFLNA